MIFVINLISILARVLNLLILARVLLSWIPMSRGNQLVEIIYALTEPILGPIRRVLPSLGGLDLSPIVALLLLEVVRTLLVRLLIGLV
ncbi:MAG: YggT family protein [Anaerolineae bacterium]